MRRLAFFDPACALLARARWGGEKIRAGVDPIFLPQDSGSVQQARARLGVPAEAFTVLLFGAFSERKGIVQMLDLLRETNLARPLHVLIGGSVDANIRPRFETALSALKTRHAVHYFDGFVPDAEMADYFSATDLVLCAYKDFTGSSGVLLHGAAHGKPALVSPGGVMADAVRCHDFGKIVHLDDADTFHMAIAHFANLDAGSLAELAERARGYARANDARRYLGQFI
jgi:glycosyltransferase involved in cell wall biosynthesis